MSDSRRTAAQLICGAYETRELTPRETCFFQDFPPSGLTVFSRNLEEANLTGLRDELKKIQNLKPSLELPFIFAIDQEGGRVRRLKKAPDIGTPFYFNDEDTGAGTLLEISEYGKALAKYLIDLHINVNFAPVVDIWTEKTNLSIGDRCFGQTPESVILRAGSFLDGLQSAGILGCLKHFPGQGDAKNDTHLETTVIDISRELFDNRELVPFAKLLKNISMVMISHGVFKNIDSKPASLSFDIQEKILRQKLKFTGVIVSDDMNMAAISQDEQMWSEALVESLMAGTDLFLVCRDIEKCFRAVDTFEKAQRKSSAVSEKIYKSVTRVRDLRRKLFIESS